MSESEGVSIGEAVVVKALYEVLVVEAEKKGERKRQIKTEIARLEKENPKTIEAFEEREARIKALLDEFSELGGK